MKQTLDRTLGLYSALTISIGTMIGSAIFVLAGTSYEVAGPGASLAIFLAGVAAVFTGLSFAELVTIIPKAGGGYAYVREATNNSVVGFICGWGFWLGYAMSCGLFALGFGNFINYFFPFIPQMLAAYVLIIYVTYTNIRGVESSGKLQNIITTGLVLLLLGYIVIGVFHFDIENQRPFLPNGLPGMFSAMGFLYMTYIGYGLITTASEEVIEPEKTIPKAIMISIGFVIFLKTAVFFIGSGIIPWTQLLPSVTNTPLTDTAVNMGGALGGYLFAFAGILATLSSINTAIMASSRTSFALARDQHFPAIFKTISRKTRTPIFSIVVSSLIVVVAVTIKDLEHISTVTSIFSLTGYSLVNVALMIFRKNEPNIERKFKVPFYPLTPIIGIGVNIFLIYQLALSDRTALIISIIIICLGLLFYYITIPKLKFAPKGIASVELPQIENNLGLESESEIIVPVSNPNTMDILLNFGKKMAQLEQNTTLVPVRVNMIPENVISSGDYDLMIEETNKQDKIVQRLKIYEKESYIKPVIIESREVFHAIMSIIKQANEPFVIIGWHGTGLLKHMHGSILVRLLQEARADIGILKPYNQTMEYKKILFPYGGGKYSQMTAKIVNRIAKAHNSEITLLNVINADDDKDEIIARMTESAKTFDQPVNVKVCQDDLVERVIEISAEYDLIILGASLDWGIREMITGLRSDIIAEKAKTSVLIVKSYHAILQRKRIRNFLYKTRKFLQGRS
jgi:amino acid transporter/nucleotide-binding universal stress UspA family protein